MSRPYPNPLIPGFNPDPSVVRVGDDWFLATSTFEYLPGMPIYRSRDFVTWELIGHVATRVGQFDVEEVPTAGGAWAPTIRHRDGVFHLVITDAMGRGMLHFTATDAAGPWSDGDWSSSMGVDGIDPDLAWDADGTVYMTYSGLGREPGAAEHRQAPRHPAGEGRPRDRHARSRSRARIWSGIGGQFPEAPHLYRIGDWWYLDDRRGRHRARPQHEHRAGLEPRGAVRERAAATRCSRLARTDRPIQNTGHGDLVIGPDGEWLLVLLGVRPRSMTRAFSALGRETFVTTVTGATTAGRRSSRCSSTRARAPWRSASDFDAAGLGPEWLAVRRTPASVADLGARPGSVVAAGRRLDARRPHPGVPRAAPGAPDGRASRSPSTSRPASAGSPCDTTSDSTTRSRRAAAGSSRAAPSPGSSAPRSSPFTGTTVELELRSRRPDGGPFEARTSRHRRPRRDRSTGSGRVLARARRPLPLQSRRRNRSRAG